MTKLILICFINHKAIATKFNLAKIYTIISSFYNKIDLVP